MVMGLLNNAGWHVNHKRVERRREGLKVPQKQGKKRRLWLSDGSCVRLKLNVRTMSGPMTSSRIALLTGGPIGH